MIVCRSCLLTSVVLATTAFAAEPKFTNRLSRESSPYLLQHAHNPVDWYPWGDAAFAKARKEGKLIFLSSGYSSCHWCHVMERECFTNEEVAALLNDHFVCIKLDREERPEVDHLYLTALQVMGRSGGWPLSMFLTADGKPIAGGTYWPPDDREINGDIEPGFKSVLKAVISAQQGAPENLIRTAELRALQTRQQLALAAKPAGGIALNRRLVDATLQELQQTFDAEHGGFGAPPSFRGPKFPRPPLLKLLQNEAARNRSDELDRMLHTTLERLARGGIYDQLGGGFHRYSVERTWTVPHFEKMLYDNAQLLEIYAAAYSGARRELYEQVLRKTLAHVFREMSSPEGLFYTALDADSSGEEGRYYVWTTDELSQALPNADDLAFFEQSYALQAEPNFEGRYYILTKPADMPDSSRLNALSQRLLAVREQRPRPLLDTKVLASWNGLMIAGVAAAGKALDDSTAIDRASRAAETLLAAVKSPSGRLYHTYAAAPGDKPKPRIPGYLDDYTHLVHGLLALHEATKDEKWLAEARSLTDTMIAQFHDQPGGGFFYTSAEHEPLFARIKDQYDGVQPCGNSQAAANLVALWRLTGNERYRDLAKETFDTFAVHLRDEPRSLCTMTAALAEFLKLQERDDQ